MDEAERSAQRPSGGMRWEDGLVYGLVLAGIYILVGVLFFYGGKDKLFEGLGAPAPIAKQFEGTFLNTIPGIDAAWTILGVLEFLIFLFMVASLMRLEFLPTRRKPLLLCGLALAVFTFSILAIGQNVVGEHEGVASLYLYTGATGVLIGMVLLMPPYRPSNWISARGGSP